MTSLRDKLTEILKDALVECPILNTKTVIVLDGKWYALKWGCDTFDHLRDALVEIEEKKEEGND